MAEENKKTSTIMIVMLITLFILVTYYVVTNNFFTSRSSFEDANSFFEIFEGIVNGNMSQVSYNLNPGLTFMGMFIMLFLILFFGMKVSLGHIINKQGPLVIFAFILSIYGFINNAIYSYIVNGSTYLVAALVFIVLIMILWGTFDHVSKIGGTP